MRPVVYHDDLQRRVSACQERFRALDDERLLVISRRDKADTRSMTELSRVTSGGLLATRVPRDLAKRHGEQGGRGHTVEHEETENSDRDGLENLNHALTSATLRA